MAGRAVRWVGAFGLSLALTLSACGDDEKSEEGHNDGEHVHGDGDAADGGAGEDAGEALPELAVKCGELTCLGAKLSTPPSLHACCLEVDGEPACGLESTRLTGPKKPECVPREAVGAASPSCMMVWDKTDFAAENDDPDAGAATDKTDGKFSTIAAPGILAQFDGCCTAAGTCSIDFKSVGLVILSSGNSAGTTDVGYGCADPEHVGLDAASMAAGFGESIACDPASGMITEAPMAP